MAEPVTELLLAWSAGDGEALDRLIPLIHTELQTMAKRYMAGERRGHTLQPTALVNEVYLRLVDVKRVQWQNRAHFLAVASRLMRRVLVDAARARGYQKRGGGAEHVPLDEALVIDVERGHELVALDEALERLATFAPRQSEIVDMRYFGGLTNEEVAAVLNVSEATVMGDWKLAKSWLLRELSRDGSEGRYTQRSSTNPS
jgi:RNA polymerase sigma factor (TIGR02999 family)